MKHIYHVTRPDLGQIQPISTARSTRSKAGKQYHAVIYEWLDPVTGKRISLEESTWEGYRRKIERHILPTPGCVCIRRLKVSQIESLYDSKLQPVGPGYQGLGTQDCAEIHLIIRGALATLCAAGC